MKSLFIDCNDQLASVGSGSCAPTIRRSMSMVAFAPAELPRLLNGYDICIDDHSYLPTAPLERCDGLKHIIFLGIGAGAT